MLKQHVLNTSKRSPSTIPFSSPPSFASIFKRFEIFIVKTLNILFVHQHLNFKLPHDLCIIIYFNQNHPTRRLECPKVSAACGFSRYVYLFMFLPLFFIIHWVVFYCLWRSPGPKHLVKKVIIVSDMAN